MSNLFKTRNWKLVLRDFLFLLVVLTIGANCSENRDRANLFNAIHRGELNNVKILLNSGIDVNGIAGTVKKESPLIFAAYFNNPKMVELILRYNPDLEYEDNTGATALCYTIISPYIDSREPATITNAFEAAKLLIKAGASRTNHSVIEAVTTLDESDIRKSLFILKND